MARRRGVVASICTVLLAAIALLGYVRPVPAEEEAAPGAAVSGALHGPPEPIHGPPPPGLRLPGWLPRGEVFWERGPRYRLLDRPRVTLDGGLPDVSLTDEPLIGMIAT